MTLVKRGRIWHYDFWYKGARHQSTTGQELKDDAEQVERDVKRQLRREAFGIATITPAMTPTFTAWAERFLEHKQSRIERPDVLEKTLRMVLAFWGAAPTTKPPIKKGGVYHNLRLGDPIHDPDWIDKFEAWMITRGLSASARNSYRSAMSGMYKFALRPRNRKRTHVSTNPFEHVDRDTPDVRAFDVSVEDLRRWIRHAAPHALLALTIGALAPKLRLAQVLALRFDEHLDRELTTITWHRYKRARQKRRPQVTAVSKDLRRVLDAIRRARPESPHVITFRDKPIASIKRAVKTAAKEAGLVYGIKKDGVTFHALRGVMVTECARLGIGEVLAARVVDHRDPRTTRKHYTHLVDRDELAVVEQLAAHLDVTDLAIVAAGKTVGTRKMAVAKLAGIRAKARHDPEHPKSA